MDAETKNFLDDLSREIRQGNAQLRRLVQRHDDMLMGTAHTPELRTTVDRLTQTEKTRKWHLRALWTGMLGLAAKFAGDHFIK